MQSARLVRHSKAERRSNKIGQAACLQFSSSQTSSISRSVPARLSDLRFATSVSVLRGGLRSITPTFRRKGQHPLSSHGIGILALASVVYQDRKTESVWVLLKRNQKPEVKSCAPSDTPPPIPAAALRLLPASTKHAAHRTGYAQDCRSA